MFHGNFFHAKMHNAKSYNFGFARSLEPIVQGLTAKNESFKIFNI